MFSKDNTLFVNLLTLITNLKDFLFKLLEATWKLLHLWELMDKKKECFYKQEIVWCFWKSEYLSKLSLIAYIFFLCYFCFEFN